MISPCIEPEQQLERLAQRNTNVPPFRPGTTRSSVHTTKINEANYRHFRIFKHIMLVRLCPHTASNPNDTLQVMHRNINVLAVRPGPTGSFHQFNQNKRTPSIAIVVYCETNGSDIVAAYCTEPEWQLQRRTQHRHANVRAVRPGPTISLHRLNQNNQRYRCIDWTKIIGARRS